MEQPIYSASESATRKTKIISIIFAAVFLLAAIGIVLAFDALHRQTSQEIVGNLESSQIVIPEKEPIDETQALDSLIPELEAITKKHSDVFFGIVVTDLTNDESISLKGSTTVRAASLYKLFVAYEIMKLIDAGSLSLTEATGNDAGSRSVESCLEIMITVSNNECGRAFRKTLSANNRPVDSLAESGFVSTHLSGDFPTTNAVDVSEFYRQLYANESDLKDSSNAYLLDFLKDQKRNSRLPTGLPDGTVIAHKTGELTGYGHDAGIVYSDGGDFVITVLSGPWNNEYTQTPEPFGEIAKATYDFFNSN